MDVASILSSIMSVFTTVFMLGLLAAIGILIRNHLKFKNWIILRKITGSKKLIVHDKYKVFKDEDGIFWWRLKKHKINLIPAPEDAIEITEKGAMFVEAYFNDEQGYCYLKDNHKIDMKNKSASDVFCQLDTSEKAVLTHQFAKAAKRNSNNFWTQNIGMIVGATTIIIIMVLAMANWAEVMQHAIDLSSSMGSVADKLDVTASKLDSVINNKQKMEQDTTIPIIVHNDTT